MENGCGAFAKGGCGCLALFAVLAVLALLVGGNVHADIAGLAMLFVIGGVIGLIVYAIYNKGRRDAAGGRDRWSGDRFKDPPGGPPRPLD